MRDIFESESEEEYDKTFGEGEEEIIKPASRVKRRNSNDTQGSMFGDNSNDHTSNSHLSEGSGEEFDDDYLKKLRERSMQQEVKELLYESKSHNSFASDAESQTSEISRQSPRRHRAQRTDSASEVMASPRRANRGKARVRRNQSGEVIGADVDPADVYARELEKKKERKTFSVADLRKEMEELRQGGAAGKSSFDVFGASSKDLKKAKQSPKPKPKRSAFGAGMNTFGAGMNTLGAGMNTGINTLGAGMNTLGHMANKNNPAPGALNRISSFATTTSDQGLLKAVRKGSNFGGNLAAHPTIVEDDEEAFLTGGGGKFGKKQVHDTSSAHTKTGITPAPDSQHVRAGFSSAGLGSTMAGSPGGLPGLGGGPPGDLGGTGFQEPLPLPDMEDDYNPGRSKKKFAMGKMFKKGMSKFKFGKKGSQEMGMLGDDDDDASEGGMGLLG
jgi:hypothetical protein